MAGIEESAGNQHFPGSSQCFQKLFYPELYAKKSPCLFIPFPNGKV